MEHQAASPALVPTGPRAYWGKYRAVVSSNEDPLGLHRLLTRVAAVPGAEMAWALPCVPYAGPDVGLVCLPPIGAHVWIEFENGDPTFPIWTGCFWAPDEAPVASSLPGAKVLQTPGVQVLVDDTAGAARVTLTVGTATVTIDEAGVVFSVGGTLLKIATDGLTALVAPSTSTPGP